MFDRSSKNYLYLLLEHYLEGKITEATFCDEYYYSYDLSVDYSTLIEEEHKHFSELATVSGRYSDFEEDHLRASNAYTTTQQLRDKITEVYSKLGLSRKR